MYGFLTFFCLCTFLALELLLGVICGWGLSGLANRCIPFFSTQSLALVTSCWSNASPRGCAASELSFSDSSSRSSSDSLLHFTIMWGATAGYLPKEHRMSSIENVIKIRNYTKMKKMLFSMFEAITSRKMWGNIILLLVKSITFTTFKTKLCWVVKLSCDKKVAFAVLLTCANFDADEIYDCGSYGR